MLIDRLSFIAFWIPGGLRSREGPESEYVSRGWAGNLATQLWYLADIVRTGSAPAKAALFTGAYILIAGLLLLIAPLTFFTLLFDKRQGTSSSDSKN